MGEDAEYLVSLWGLPLLEVAETTEIAEIAETTEMAQIAEAAETTEIAEAFLCPRPPGTALLQTLPIVEEDPELVAVVVAQVVLA